jgi:hypothetical protein
MLLADIPQYFSLILSAEYILPGKLVFTNQTKATTATIYASYTRN